MGKLERQKFALLAETGRPDIAPPCGHLRTLPALEDENASEAEAGGEARVKGCLGAVVAIAVLAALAIYIATPHPTWDEAKVKAIAVESQQLMAAYPMAPTERSVEVPKDRWPPTIASLKPYSVFVRQGMVDITTKPFFDGGWGYGFAKDKRNLTMLVECCSELGHNVHWHGPC